MRFNEPAAPVNIGQVKYNILATTGFLRDATIPQIVVDEGYLTKQV